MVKIIMTTDEKKVKHLEIIQAIIVRMSDKSFQVKNWTITLISAILVLSDKEQFIYYIGIAFIPTISFWILNTHFLKYERLFRALYNDVISPASTVPEFSLDISGYKSNPENKFWNVFKSETSLYFYVTLIVLIIIIFILSFIPLDRKSIKNSENKNESKITNTKSNKIKH